MKTDNPHISPVIAQALQQGVEAVTGQGQRIKATMTPEAQRIAIAEECRANDRWVIVKRGLYYRPNGCGYTHNLNEAWIVTEEEADKHVYPHGDEPVRKYRAPLPDYLNDLNACHEMEKTLDDFLFTRYCDELVLVIMGPADAPDPIWLNCGNSARQLAVKATAAQRCEAFLKAKGRWNP